MEVDYAALEGAAKCLSTAATQVTSEVALAAELGSSAASPDGSYASAVNSRDTTLAQLAVLMEAQSKSCSEMVTLFQLLDAQIASQVMDRS